MAKLEGRVALVTGGAGGMGLASSCALAAEGAAVIVADRDGGAAEQTVKLIKTSGGKAEAYQIDFGSRTELRALFDYVQKTYGRLNVLFSNVGVTGPKSFDVTDEQFDDALNINLKSHFFATNYAVPLLRSCAPRASVIYMSSGAALRTDAPPLYSISKASLVMMARLFARHLGPEGIRVNALCPGPIRTNFSREWLGVSDTEYDSLLEQESLKVPLRRIGTPEDIAGVVVFFASDESSYLTGLALPVDGGGSMA